MEGLEKITGSILQEAGEKASAILRKAQDDAEEILKRAENERTDLLVRTRQKEERDAETYAASIASRAARKTREALLSEKQAIIHETIQKACHELADRDDSQYFRMIENLVRRYIRAENGEILFGQRDLHRLPSGFEDRLNRIAGDAGGSLQISRNPADIENGFLLRYGGIDENCTLKALFEEKMDLLQDAVHEMLFRQEKRYE